uniref:xanthine dehydrogenase n=1 Tax=Methylocella sp. TaxID=1978226 RepID=UPI003784F65E
MNDFSRFRAIRRKTDPFAVILGANEIASAVAVALVRDGWSVVLSRDPSPPVVRRGMAFDDALFGDRAALFEVSAERADTGFEVLAALGGPNRVVATPLGLLDLIVLRPLDLLVDARLQPARERPDIRNLARFAIGVGPGFVTAENCDVALALPPAALARLGGEDAGASGGRFLRAQRRGRWRTAVDLGARAFRGFVVGHVVDGRDREPLAAEIDGVLVGVARDGAEVAEGDIVAEVDARTRQAAWSGLDPSGRAVAKAALRAIETRAASVAV